MADFYFECRKIISPANPTITIPEVLVGSLGPTYSNNGNNFHKNYAKGVSAFAKDNVSRWKRSANPNDKLLFILIHNGDKGNNVMSHAICVFFELDSNYRLKGEE